MLECPYCGHQNPDDQARCEACGQPLAAQEIDPPSPQADPVSIPQTASSQNPSPQKPFPWGWAAYGCAVAVLAVLVLVVGAIDVFKWAPRLANVRTNPASGSAPATTGNDLPFTLTAVNSVDSMAGPTLFSGMTQALNLNNDTDFQAPKHYTGALALDQGTPFSLGNGWCAKDQATLKNNLASLQYTFTINGTDVDLSKYPTLFFTDNRGESCAITGINITPSPNTQGVYRIEVTQHYAKTIQDGISAVPYPAGDVTFDFTLRLQLPSPPGLNG